MQKQGKEKTGELILQQRKAALKREKLVDAISDNKIETENPGTRKLLSNVAKSHLKSARKELFLPEKEPLVQETCIECQKCDKIIKKVTEYTEMLITECKQRENQKNKKIKSLEFEVEFLRKFINKLQAERRK